METRQLNISYGKSKSGSITPRMSVPISWLKAMGVTPEDRAVKVTYDGNKIIIEKE